MAGAPMRKVTTLLSLVMTLAACQQGRDFAKPSPESFVLGTTSRAEIVNRFGPPERQSSEIRSDTATVQGDPFAPAPMSGTFAAATYIHRDRTNVLFGGAGEAKSIVFVFWNDVLVSYNYASNFSTDSSNFDDSKVTSLEKGKMAKVDVIQLLGAPTGRRVYPLIQNQGDEEFIYAYANVVQQQIIGKTLRILLTSDGKIRDYRFSTDSRPVPAPSR